MASDLSARPAKNWQEIQGLNNWAGLFEPLHPDLREAGIRYGEFVEAVYDAIDMQTDTEYVYYSLFGKSKLFSSVGIVPGYTITKYLYSTLVVDSWGKLFGLKKGASTVWLGYIAVSNEEETKRLGRRDVVVIFRGTKAPNEWWINAHFGMVQFKELGPAPYPMVSSGFLSMYMASDASKMFGGLSVREQIFGELKRLIQVQYSKEDMSITFVGHSMGAGMAPLAAADFGFNMPAVAQGRTVMVTAFVFGAPKTGDAVFKERAEKSCKVIRIIDTGDPVVLLPPGVYEHVGVEWKVNWADSPDVQDLGIISMKCHNLELYLHCIAGQKNAAAIASVQKNAVEGAEDDDDETTADVPEELNSLKELFKDDPHVSVEKFAKEQAAIVKASRQMLSLTSATSGDKAGRPSVKRLKTTINFEMAVDRDPALMNKSDDVVITDLGIPEAWWVHAYKNMRYINGKWLPRQRWPAFDIPSEDNPEFD